jgi:hypothetical protein
MPPRTVAKVEDEHDGLPSGMREPNKDSQFRTMDSELEHVTEGDQTVYDYEDSFLPSDLGSSPTQAKHSAENAEESYIDDSGESFVNDSRESFAHNNEESFVTDAEESLLAEEGQSMLSEGVSFEDSSLGHDDARDVMNMPPSYVAPSHRPQDFHNVASGDRDLLGHEVEQLTQCRLELEAEIEADRKKHEQDTKRIAPSAGSVLSLSDLQEQVSAVSLTEGVVAIDPDQLDRILAQDNSVSNYDEGSAPLTPGATAAIDPDQLEKVLSSPASQSFSASPAVTTEGRRASLIPEPLGQSPAPAAHATGEATSQNTPSPMQIALPSSPTSTSPTRTRANSTPTRQALGASARRISFTKDPIVSETPFTGALKHFKTYQNATKTKGTRNKENSPSKSRRNASLPEEIAELAKEIDEGIEDAKDTLMMQQRRQAAAKEESEDLEKYRDADLAPLDPVLEGKNTEDLIMGGTPVKSTLNAFKNFEDEQRVQAGLFGSPSQPVSAAKYEIGKDQGLNASDFNNGTSKSTAAGTIGKCETVMLGQSTTSKPTKCELSVPDHTGALAKLKIETNASPQQIGEYIRQKGTGLDADEGDIDDAVKVGPIS